MPDIVIEVLAPAQPLVLINRTLIHFFICVSLLLISVVVCSPGGANIAAIIVHNHDQNLRFVMLFLESMVFMQFCAMAKASHRDSLILLGDFNAAHTEWEYLNMPLKEDGSATQPDPYEPPELSH
ncbi:hypothetical protein HPB52_024415 [Rhipicephalus sanguineus]|uniref:Endonuclease/exonuclease/phosphatase domain-containing protein n=1 Tax=Rhipicephalus sanguineus TaxID=34632 RepID=A0A9D4SMQ4_RHISA|nr:hypothetical protein HPB52_024415 [Rhipicephalus sanguineus]